MEAEGESSSGCAAASGGGGGACGHVGMWACGHVGMWACGHVGNVGDEVEANVEEARLFGAWRPKEGRAAAVLRQEQERARVKCWKPTAERSRVQDPGGD